MWRSQQGNASTNAGNCSEEKAYTTTPERKALETFSGLKKKKNKKTFQAGGRYKNPIKTREAISTTEILPLWPPFLRKREVPHWSRVVYGFIFPDLLKTRGMPSMEPIQGTPRKIMLGIPNRLATPLASYRIGFGPAARNRKKIGKI